MMRICTLYTYGSEVIDGVRCVQRKEVLDGITKIYCGNNAYDKVPCHWQLSKIENFVERPDGWKLEGHVQRMHYKRR